MREHLQPLRKYNPVVLVNICNINHNIATISALIRKDFPGAVLITSPNKGKDIGGKMALVDLFLKLNLQPSFLVFLHDKISPHAVKGEKWRNTLFNIVKPTNVNKILNEFSHNNKVGLMGSAEFVMNEYDAGTGQFATSNNEKIKELLHKYHIKIKDFSFIGGSMFWVRSSIIRNFFLKTPALHCREMLEEGNVMDDLTGTYTHAWERLLCWIAIAEHYTIKGI